MNVIVINGSPAGENSITLQTVLYIEKRFPQTAFSYLNVGAKTRSIEKDFSEAKQELERADLVLFAYPVYTFLVPSQLHRFVELMKASGIDFTGKFATQISTSKHFYDSTAHRFIQENCDDMGFKSIRGLSADMEDLLHDQGQQDALRFWKHVEFCVKKDIYDPAIYPANATATFNDSYFDEKKWINQDDCGYVSAETHRVVILTDLTGHNGPEYVRLQRMIEQFQHDLTRRNNDKISFAADVVDLANFAFKGGCLGCFHCAGSGQCIYKDHFDTFLRENIQRSDAIVTAFVVQDHSMGYRFKLYDDRQFCNGHRTVTMGKPNGYLIAGPYSREENLRTLVTARAQVGGNYLAGVATDEVDTGRQIRQLADNLAYAILTKYQQPADFYGVGGMKIFRDLIWQMQGMMKEDHRFYKKHGFYDFPQKKLGSMLLMYLVGFMMTNEKVKAKMGSHMTEGMLMPYKRIVEKNE